MTIILLLWWSLGRGNWVVPSSWQATVTELSPAREVLTERAALQYDLHTTAPGEHTIALCVTAEMEIAGTDKRRALHTRSGEEDRRQFSPLFEAHRFWIANWKWVLPTAGLLGAGIGELISLVS